MAKLSTDAARLLASLPRQPHQGACALCGKAFLSVGRRRYCSRTCQNKADYERHAEQRRAAKRTAQD